MNALNGSQNGNHFFTEDMIVINEDLLKTIRLPVIQLKRIKTNINNNYNNQELNEFIDENNANNSLNNKQMKGNKNNSNNGLKVLKCDYNECVHKSKYKSCIIRHMNAVHKHLKPFKC